VPQERWSELAERLSMTHPVAGSAAPRTGADLRAARERIGWSLPDMAAALRIRRQHLEALEDGRIVDLPGTAYTLGFVRTYASALGLDPDEVARRFKTEAAAVNRHTDLDFPTPAPEHRVPPGAIALVGMLLAVGTYAGWYHLSGEGRLPAETSVQIPARLAPLAEQAMPPHAAQPSPVVAPAAAPAEPAPVQLAETPSAPSISPGSAAAAALPADQPHIVLRANADSWLQVRDRSGPVLLSRTLHAGETWAVPDRPNLLLTTGNAGGTDILVDGAAAPSLGSNGAVRRDLPLDPELIRTGRLAAAATQPAGPRPNAQ